ncbi:AmmeMemoRadiSam system protein A [Marinobacter sp. Arc7-DN-1]|uniref:AmmeMemoRadiSam system protein A n=1 Tax=Marinobacter sp. Arc7-DN-1 TaxID=2304594 RepID=UPI000E447544|nr:AmmeMemoRadiSam system protein A [Marinobacter sp. Arc7-DN-1]AXS81622.1 AmmeMemoRadiSam system protein A [Marinobacter sp. Arc7-DN-1]
MLNEQERQALLQAASASVYRGLDRGQPLPVEPEEYPEKLAKPGACFVTLTISGRLRGCVGSLEAWRPLIQDCAENAFAAAFRDFRFPPVAAQELDLLDYQVSVLSVPAPLYSESEDDLLSQLRPGTDGLVLVKGDRRATFLPSVWESLPEPQEFLRHLKQKAGLAPEGWSGAIKALRYTVESIRRM